MNYYEHHIGDYAQATAHLTFVEDAAYSRLIRKYYADERPLPSDIKVVQRLMGARTKEEKQAVEAVLNEFFSLTDEGWVNRRCEGEITKYRAKSEKSRASAEVRWSKRSASDMRTHSEGNAGAMRTHSEGNAHQTPDTRHQTPESTTTPSPISRKQILGAGETADSGQETHGQEQNGAKLTLTPPEPEKNVKRRVLTQDILAIFNFLNTKTGQAYRAQHPDGSLTSGATTLKHLMAKGYTPDDVRKVIARKARDWGADTEMQQYLRPETLFGQKKFESYLGQCVSAGQGGQT
jgi:uncharacterized phage protein (TIGR02220 family)